MTEAEEKKKKYDALIFEAAQKIWEAMDMLMEDYALNTYGAEDNAVLDVREQIYWKREEKTKGKQ
jgi:hypothetical protein